MVQNVGDDGDGEHVVRLIPSDHPVDKDSNGHNVLMVHDGFTVVPPVQSCDSLRTEIARALDPPRRGVANERAERRALGWLVGITCEDSSAGNGAVRSALLQDPLSLGGGGLGHSARLSVRLGAKRGRDAAEVVVCDFARWQNGAPTCTVVDAGRRSRGPSGSNAGSGSSPQPTPGRGPMSPCSAVPGLGSQQNSRRVVVRRVGRAFEPPIRSLVMESADGAQDASVILEGVRYQLVRYGEETLAGAPAFAAPCHVCGTESPRLHLASCRLGPGSYSRPARCRDCGVAVGDLHVMGCGIEDCPRCGGQYESCDCNGSEDDAYPGGRD